MIRPVTDTIHPARRAVFGRNRDYVGYRLADKIWSTSTARNAGSKVKRKPDNGRTALIYSPIGSEAGAGGRKGRTQTWRWKEAFAVEVSQMV